MKRLPVDFGHRVSQGKRRASARLTDEERSERAARRSKASKQTWNGYTEEEREERGRRMADGQQRAMERRARAGEPLRQNRSE